MNQRRRKRPDQRDLKKNSKIIRCNLHTRPVFELDTCVKFEKNINRDSESNCRNCKFSF